MPNTLVSLRETAAHRSLLAKAVDWVGGDDGELILQWHLDEAEYDADLETLESVGRIEHTDYDHASIVDGAASDARAFVEPLVADATVDPRIVVTVDSESTRARRVFDTAAEHDCDHVFIVGRSRSPAGKAVFSDLAQQVILEFDGTPPS